MTKFVPFALLATVATLAVIPTTVFAAEANQQVRAVADGTAATAAVVRLLARCSMAPMAAASLRSIAPRQMAMPS